MSCRHMPQFQDCTRNNTKGILSAFNLKIFELVKPLHFSLSETILSWMIWIRHKFLILYVKVGTWLRLVIWDGRSIPYLLLAHVLHLNRILSSSSENDIFNDFFHYIFPISCFPCIVLLSEFQCYKAWRHGSG